MTATDYQTKKNKPAEQFDSETGEFFTEYSADAWPKGESLADFPSALVGYGFGRTQSEANRDAIAHAMSKAEDFRQNPHKYL